MTQTREELLSTIETLQARLGEVEARAQAAEEALRAIQSGEMDAPVVYAQDSDPVLTVEGADRTYRVMVESIQEGVATLQADGMLLYANQRLAEMLGIPLEKLLGTNLLPCIVSAEREIYSALLRKGIDRFSKGEITLRRQDGLALPALLSISGVGNPGERVICLVVTDLSEQKRHEEILAAERLARSILEQASEAVMVCDLQGMIIQASRAAHALARDNPLYQPFEKVFPLVLNSPEEEKGESFSIGAVLRGQSYRGLETRLAWEEPSQAGPSRVFYLQLNATPLRNDRDEVVGCLLALVDITERRQMEEALKESEKKYRELVKNAPTGIYEIDFRRKKFISVNDSMCQLSGYTRDELLKMDPVDLLDEAGRITLQQRIQQWLSGEKPEETVEYRVKAKDGHEIYVILNVNFKVDKNGNLVGAAVIGTDITERKKAEQALLEATRRAEENQLILEAVIQQMPVGIILTDALGTMAKNNAAMDRIWRRAMLPQENPQQHAYRAFHADGREYQMEEWPLTRALANGEVILGEEMTILRGDGTRGTVHASSAPVRDKSGKIIAGVVIDVDISERKEMEERLAYQAGLLAQVQDAVIATDEKMRVTYWTQVAEETFGWTEAEALGKNGIELLEIQIPGLLRASIMQQALEVGRYEGEALFRRKDGGYIHVHAKSTLLKGSQGEFKGVVTSARDITERKQAENALRESEQLYRAIGESIDYGVWVCAPDGRNLYASQSFLQLVGITQEQCSEFGWGDTLHPEDAERTIASWKECVRTEGNWDIEHRFRGVDGKYHSVLARGVPVRNEQGKVIYWAGINLDIDHIKEAEQALQESEARERSRAAELEAIMAAVPAYMWITRDPQAREMTGNGATLNLMRMQPGENISKTGPDPEKVSHLKFMRTGHEIPNEQLPVQLAAAAGKPVRDYELEMVFASGETRHLLGNAEPLLDEHGRPAGAVSAFIDITQRKQAEQALERLNDQLEERVAERTAALRESEERYRTLFESMDEGFCIIKVLFDENERPVDYCFLEVNPAFGRQTGIENAAGRRMREIAPQHEAYWFEIYGKIALTGEPMRFENRAEMLHRFYDVFAFRVGEPGERNVAIFFTDINERKQAKQALERLNDQLEERVIERTAALRESEERYRKLVDLSPFAIFIQTGGRFTFANPAGLKLFGAEKADQLIGKLVLELTHPEHREIQTARIHTTNNENASVPLHEGKFLRLDGTPMELESVSAPIEYEGHFGALVVARDISETKANQLALLQSQENQRAAQTHMEVQRHLLDQREQERQQIARDLHDGPLQELIAVTFTLQAMLMDNCAPEVAGQLKAIRTTLQEQINELRAYAGELRPPTLVTFGLVKAIRSHLETYQKKYPELHIRLEYTWKGSLLTEKVRLTIFRIYQESLINIAKHARATQVTIQLEKTDRQVILEIEDNGVGFEVPRDWLDLLSRRHLGLVGMRERAEAINGQLEIQSRPGKGTLLILIVPVQQNQDPAGT